MSQIPDEGFSAGVLGVCCGANPEEGTITAPVDGKISQLADTCHAVGVEAVTDSDDFTSAEGAPARYSPGTEC